MTVDVPEVELALTFPSELDVAFFLFVNEVLLPDAHRDDPPAASEGVRGFRFLCHSSPFSMPIRGIDGIKPCLKGYFLGFSRGIPDVHHEPIDLQHPNQRVLFGSIWQGPLKSEWAKVQHVPDRRSLCCRRTFADSE